MMIGGGIRWKAIAWKENEIDKNRGKTQFKNTYNIIIYTCL